MSKTIPTWGFHPVEEPRIHDLAPGARLPEGWSDVPVERVAASIADVPDPAALTESLARISELETVIAKGTAENERFGKELDAAEEELDAAAKRISALTAEIASLKAPPAPPAPKPDAKK